MTIDQRLKAMEKEMTMDTVDFCGPDCDDYDNLDTKRLEIAMRNLVTHDNWWATKVHDMEYLLTAPYFTYRAEFSEIYNTLVLHNERGEVIELIEDNREMHKANYSIVRNRVYEQLD